MWQQVALSEIGKGEVHAWLADLALPEVQLADFHATLSPEEADRARRFRFDRDRRRYIASHGILRAILGRYLKRRPAELRFETELHGKPYLPADYSTPPLHFNLSHSGDRALIGLSAEGPIGVDIEFKDCGRANTEVAERFFASEEVAALAALPAGAECEAFFATWTMKEAYIKARGEGISLGLGTFAVAWHDTPALIRSDHGAREIDRWRFWQLDTGPDYAASIAAECGEARLKTYRFCAIT